MNGYPLAFFNKVVEKLAKDFNKPKTTNEFDLTLELPFYGHPSKRLANDLEKIINKIGNIKIVFVLAP